MSPILLWASPALSLHTERVSVHASARTRAPRSWKKSCDGHRMQWFELGQSELCFGVEIVSARVLIAMMMPAGGLELKLLSACKMVLVRPCHGTTEAKGWERVLKYWGATCSFRECCCGVLLHVLGCGGRMGSCYCSPLFLVRSKYFWVNGCTVHLTKYCVSTHLLWGMIILCYVVLIRLWTLHFKDVTAELITFCMYF